MSYWKSNGLADENGQILKEYYLIKLLFIETII